MPIKCPLEGITHSLINLVLSLNRDRTLSYAKWQIHDRHYLSQTKRTCLVMQEDHHCFVYGYVSDVHYPASGARFLIFYRCFSFK